MMDAGLIVMTALSPQRERDVRTSGTDNFVEIFVDTPLDVCGRDPKGCTRRLEPVTSKHDRADSPYEPPLVPKFVAPDTSDEDIVLEICNLLAYARSRSRSRLSPSTGGARPAASVLLGVLIEAAETGGNMRSCAAIT
jgi:adenylylsulfate kinase-like enzyme